MMHPGEMLDAIAMGVSGLRPGAMRDHAANALMLALNEQMKRFAEQTVAALVAQYDVTPEVRPPKWATQDAFVRRFRAMAEAFDYANDLFAALGTKDTDLVALRKAILDARERWRKP